MYHVEDKNDHGPGFGGSTFNGAVGRGARCTSSTAAAALTRRLNHDGVELLRSGGQDDKAIAILRLGLVQMKSEISLDAGIHPCSTTTRSSTTNDVLRRPASSPPSPLPGIVVPSQPAPPFLQPSSSSHTVSTTSTPHHYLQMALVPVYLLRRAVHHPVFVYTNAFTFQHDDRTTIITRDTGTMIEDTAHEDGEEGRTVSSIYFSQIITSEILSATIIYNLALAIQMKAIEVPRIGLSSSSNSTIQAARRAFVLYEMCIKVLNPLITRTAPTSTPRSFSTFHESVAEAGTERNAPPPASTVMNIPALCLSIACFNNMAHLVYIEEDYEQWRTVTSSLQFLLCMYFRSLKTRDFITPFLDSDIDGFKWNSLLLALPITAKVA